MKKLVYTQINLLLVLVDIKMATLESAIENNRISPFTEIALNEYNEIESILKDMRMEADNV